MPQRKPSDTATTSRHHFWLTIARKHRKGCASRRAIWKGWCSRGSGRFARPGATSVTRSALRNAFGLSERCLAAPPVEMKSLVREIVERVTVAADRIEIRLSQADEAGAVCGESSQHAARPRDGANTR